jgi:hypothetical protein
MRFAGTSAGTFAPMLLMREKRVALVVFFLVFFVAIENKDGEIGVPVCIFVRLIPIGVSTVSSL